jgi:hypothetical protein
MGNGREAGIFDVVWVDPVSFDKSKTVEMAAEIGRIDEEFKKLGKSYILAGPGRWGTRDRWLGIPVSFSQISKARIIVEVDFPDFIVESSLGSHFFHNLTSMNIGYMKIPIGQDGRMDWKWLKSQPEKFRSEHCVWTSLDKPFEILMDGRKSVAVVLKPGTVLQEKKTWFTSPAEDIIDG